MSTYKRNKWFNLVLLLVVLIMLVPQTRKPIQVFINKGLAKIVKPSLISESDRITISSYNWILKDKSGQTFDFNSVKNKVVFVNFWATWCPPCIAEMESINELYEHFESNDNIEFVIVSNEDLTTINTFMDSNDYSFKVLQAVSENPAEFNVKSIPRTFLINPNGEIVIDKTGAANWSSEEVKRIIWTSLKRFE